MKFLMLLVLVSCAHHGQSNAPVYTVRVDAVSAQAPSPQKFALKPGNDISELRFGPFAEIAKRALALDGFVSDEASPEIVIHLTAEVSEPDTQNYSDTVPVYGNTNTQINNQWGQKVGSAQTFGQTGQRTRTAQVTTYMRRVILKAVSVKTGKDVWEMKILSVGGSSDLSEAFPYMMFAATGHYGKSTAPKTGYTLEQGDKRVQALTAP